MVVQENPNKSAVSELFRPACLAPTTTPQSKPHKIPLFAILILSFQVFSMLSSPCLHAQTN